MHKAQGSEFDKVFVVIPNPCRMLSRELLYTALTRQNEQGGGPHGTLLTTTESEGIDHAQIARHNQKR